GCAIAAARPARTFKQVLTRIRKAGCIRSEKARSLLQAIDDQHAFVPRHAFVGLAEGWSVVVAGHAAKARHDSDVLLAAGSVADDAALMAEAVAMVPQLGAGRRVIGVHGPARIGDEHQIAGR